MKKLLVALAGAILFAPAVWADSEFSVVLQGGASHYVRSLAPGSKTGAAYGARLGLLPTPMLGVELGYLGTQNNVQQSLNLGRLASTIKTNEGYADVRLNILPGPLTPYVFGGYGRTWVNGAQASGIPNRSVNTLPFGGGVEANVDVFKIGGRFQYNYLFERIYTGNSASGTPTSVGADKGGNSDFWAVTLDLGASFR
jgi:Outer membrane protein beta-barrel domain